MNLKEYSLNLGITKWRTNIMKEIWVLTTDWAHDGEIGDNAELYEKEETARKNFNRSLKNLNTTD